MKYNIVILISAFLFLANTGKTYGQNPNLHIYLCFGQSNMEGTGEIETQDTISNPRFLLLQAVDCPNLDRHKGSWYNATSPLCHCNTGVSLAEQFGNTLLDNVPDSISVALINVAIGGCHIQLFDQDSTGSYVEKAPDWMKEKLLLYDNNPYKRIVEMAKIAQQNGVIKGILLHQGESNTGDLDWPNKVNKVYSALLQDLKLDAKKTPLLAGEMLSAQQGGKCSSMNEIVNKLPQTIPNAHIISSQGCEGKPDGLHFTTAGYRELGRRYADVLLKLNLD